eukprot:7649296-Pyramimonas_sp.AAC.1
MHAPPPEHVLQVLLLLVAAPGNAPLGERRLVETPGQSHSGVEVRGSRPRSSRARAPAARSPSWSTDSSRCLRP